MISRIVSDLKKFVDFFIVKYKYEQRGILKRYRLKSGLNKTLDEELWYSLFIKKAAYNYCAKFLLLKFYEDKGRIASKINKKGLEKWHDLVSNISEHYEKLYGLAEMDMLQVEEMKNVFRKTDYDIYEIDDELAEFIIEKLKEYDFRELDYQVIVNIFTAIYMSDKEIGPRLQYFYKPANTIDYILDIEKYEKDIVK